MLFFRHMVRVLPHTFKAISNGAPSMENPCSKSVVQAPDLFVSAFECAFTSNNAACQQVDKRLTDVYSCVETAAPRLDKFWRDIQESRQAFQARSDQMGRDIQKIEESFLGPKPKKGSNVGKHHQAFPAEQTFQKRVRPKRTKKA